MKDKRQKNIDKWMDTWRHKVYGHAADDPSLLLGAIGMQFGKSGITYLSDREMSEAQGRLLGQIADDISAIYRVLYVGEKDYDEEHEIRLNLALRAMAEKTVAEHEQNATEKLARKLNRHKETK